MDRCQWKMIDPKEFTLGIIADRCGNEAVIKILRPQRKKDLCLCEEHFNSFVVSWGLNHSVQFLNRGGMNEPS